jgi:hypothetical protein
MADPTLSKRGKSITTRATSPIPFMIAYTADPTLSERGKSITSRVGARETEDGTKDNLR